MSRHVDKLRATAADPPVQPRQPASHAEVRTIIFGMLLAMFLAALNQTIVATALPTIGRDFRDFANLSWVVTAYLLTSTAAAPLYGKLSDIHGRRAMMLASVGVFVVGSTVCALAPTILTLVLGRALQGLGGGGILPLAQAIIADVVAPRERGRWQAYMGSVWVSAGIAGPVFGGFLADHAHWSFVFWINVPLGLLALLLSHLLLRRLPRHERPHRLDLLGALLLIAGALPLLLALTWGGVRYPWLSPPIALLIAASALASLAFAHRMRRAPEPFLPVSVLNNPVMRWGTAASAFAQGTAIGLTIFVPLYYELVHRLSASSSGLALIAIVVSTTPGSILSGRVMMAFPRYKWVPLVGLTLAIAALTVLAAHPTMPVAGVIAVLAVAGLGIGSTYPVATVSIQNAVPRGEVGVAMGAMNFFRALTAALTVAVMGAIVLAGLGTAPERGVGAGAIAASLAVSRLDAAHTFGWVFAAAAVFLAAALFSILRMEERPLRGAIEPVQTPPPGPAE